MEIYIYRNAFSMQGGIPRLGYASAAGTFFGVAVMVLALGQAWAVRRMRAVRQDLSVGGN
jgi:raffinose/stachyose/melibiose transport system permease protein